MKNKLKATIRISKKSTDDNIMLISEINTNNQNYCNNVYNTLDTLLYSILNNIEMRHAKSLKSIIFKHTYSILLKGTNMLKDNYIFYIKLINTRDNLSEILRIIINDNTKIKVSNECKM